MTIALILISLSAGVIFSDRIKALVAATVAKIRAQFAP